MDGESIDVEIDNQILRHMRWSIGALRYCKLHYSSPPPDPRPSSTFMRSPAQVKAVSADPANRQCRSLDCHDNQSLSARDHGWRGQSGRRFVHVVQWYHVSCMNDGAVVPCARATNAPARGGRCDQNST